MSCLHDDDDVACHGTQGKVTVSCLHDDDDVACHGTWEGMVTIKQCLALNPPA